MNASRAFKLPPSTATHICRTRPRSHTRISPVTAQPPGLSSPRGHCVSPVGGGALCTDPGPESWHAYAAGCSAHLLRGFFQVLPPRVLWHKTADRACCLVRHVPSGSNVCWAWSWWADLSAACAFGQLRLLGLELEGRLGLQHVPLRSRYLSSQSAVRLYCNIHTHPPQRRIGTR